jgi:hypothetical protein
MIRLSDEGRMADGGRIFWHDDGVAIADIGCVAVVVVALPITMARLREMWRHGEEHSKLFGKERIGYTVVEPNAVADVSKEVRNEMSRMVRELPATMSATVIEGGGFKAIAGRAIVTGLMLVAGRNANHKIFGDTTQAISWLAPQLPVGNERVDAVGLNKLVERARATIERPAR